MSNIVKNTEILIDQFRQTLIGQLTAAFMPTEVETPDVRIDGENLVIEVVTKGEHRIFSTLILEPQEATEFYNMLKQAMGKMVIKA